MAPPLMRSKGKRTAEKMDSDETANLPSDRILLEAQLSETLLEAEATGDLEEAVVQMLTRVAQMSSETSHRALDQFESQCLSGATPQTAERRARLCGLLATNKLKFNAGIYKRLHDCYSVAFNAEE